MTYIAIHRNGRIDTFPAEQVAYTPTGWVPPHSGIEFDPRTCKLGKTIRYPPEKRAAWVAAGCVSVRANDARVVDDATAAALDDIDVQIKALYQRRRSLVAENFLTFRLVEEGDLKRSGARVYATKQEAARV